MEFETTREEISESDVPADIRAQIEGEISKKIKNWYRYAEEYFYGLNGEQINRDRAKKFYLLAAKAGHEESKIKLIEVYQIPKDVLKVAHGIEFKNENLHKKIEILPANDDYEKAQNYFYGWNGYAVDKSKAKKFYEKAARAGNTDAKIQLEYLYAVD